MSLSNVPILPPLFRSSKGEVSLPPPSNSSFDALFGGVLPPAQSVSSYWGKTTYYLVTPSNPTPSPSSPRQVVLIHGAGTPAIGLLPLATRLAASPTPTTVLIYDNWGHGLSSTPLAPHVPGLFHTQILHLLTHLKWSRAHFLGFSMGGLIAVSFASYYPSLVESLTLVAPAGLLRKTNLGAWARFVEWGGWGWGWGDISARRLLPIFGHDPIKPGWELEFKEKGLAAIPRDAIQKWELENHEGHMASMISFYRYGGLFDSHEIYRSVAEGDVPCLVMLGEDDGFFKAGYMAKELEELEWRGKVEVVKGVGHGVCASKTEEVAVALEQLWNGL